jgi:hypothetical protein
LGSWNLAKWPQNSKWRQKPTFSSFCSQNLNFQPISKDLNALYATSFYYLTFMEKPCFKNPKSGFYEDDIIFEKKSIFFKQSFPLKLNFFLIQKKQFCITKTQDIPKKLPV